MKQKPETTAVATATEPAHRSVAMLTPGNVSAIVPQTFDEVWRFSQVMSQSGLCPYGMDTPAKVSVAILTGLELGIKPMQAIQGIAVIGGRPCVWGDLSLGLVRASGELEYITETYEGELPNDWSAAVPSKEDRKFKAVCRVKRKGEPEVYSEFSIDDAVVAKLWNKRGASGKDSTWVTNPKRMLKMRARGFGLRDTFTDVLKGLYIAEELIGTDIDHDNAPMPTSSQISGPAAPDDEIEEAEIEQAQASAPRRESAPIIKAMDLPVGLHEGPAVIGSDVSSDQADDLDDFDPEAWVLERRVEFNQAANAQVVDEIHEMFETTASELPMAQRQEYEAAHQEAMDRFAKPKVTENTKPSPGPTTALGGPDGPDDDEAPFPGDATIQALQGPQGDEPDDGFSDLGREFDARLQAVLRAPDRTLDSLGKGFNSHTDELAALIADGDLPQDYEPKIREAFTAEYKRIKGAAKEATGGTGDPKADEMTELLRQKLAAANDVTEVNAASTETLPARNAFGSKHPLYATWREMVNVRRKEFSAIG